MTKIGKTLGLALSIAITSQSSPGAVVISEWMYGGTDGEFIEFTNVGSTAVDMTGWSYSDNARVPGSVDLSPFGSLAPGQSAVLTEALAADFRTAWTLAASVLVIGELAMNLGRSDEVNLYDASNGLVDQLTYGDQAIPGSIRTQNVSGITDPANYQANNVMLWTLSVDGANGAITSTGGDVGSPGAAAIPETSTAMLGLLGGLVMLRRRR